MVQILQVLLIFYYLLNTFDIKCMAIWLNQQLKANMFESSPLKTALLIMVLISISSTIEYFMFSQPKLICCNAIY
jgi:hypothetical protein